MTLKKVLPYAHELMKEVLKEGDTAIDGTCGNGHDTVFLANLVGETGRVYGFDIQAQAIDSTSDRLREDGMEDRVELIQDSHGSCMNYISTAHLSSLQGAIFNLGYLPGGDKSIVTTPTETIASLEHLFANLNKDGLIVLVIYHGHPGGQEEKNAILDFVSQLDQNSFQVLQYNFLNQRNNPPFVVAIEKLKPENLNRSLRL
ncbi:class I SAM-dependent methyltransferase [Halobacillus rhizosphaerae]|uniref:class I SAM-dependent methyltransferase n=1 Tax=Halobacillus rhizosphaerae TaxID=3064889 RepID=UPI00398B5E65